MERRAFQSEAMDLCLVAACKLSFWSERLRKKASAELNVTAFHSTITLTRWMELLP